ncbi:MULTISPECIES: DEAD/DEAH box helicase [Bacteroidales]|uniref:DEAD/DEAH box helicase n=1 Tax=Bacteroidales TaxID=171549 RepID=UPI0026E353A6|nr:MULTISPECIES: DEAD/DEAH box helicase [Bacteroidales]
MKFEPHPYQRRAIDWVLSHPRCGLFMEMGLGKSVCTLTAIQELKDDLMVGRVLVIAPKKVAESTWSDEAAKWDHLDLTVSVVMGTPAQRREALRADADLYVTGRDSVVWLEGLKAGKERPAFDMVVIDELTSFKSSGSQRFKAMKRLLPSVVRVVGLTGTPAPNGMLDLWAQIYCLDGGERLGRFVTKYREKYFNSIIHNNIPIKTWPKPGAAEEITAKIADICFSMKAADYLDLPPVTFTDVAVRLDNTVAEGYRRFERDRVAVFRQATTDGVVTAQNAAALVNKLAQYANGCVYDEEGGEVEIHRAKLDMLMELVEKAASPVLCFYAYRHDLRRIMGAAPKGLRVRAYEGDADLKAWNAGKVDLLLAHPASTAYGLNMQSGGHVIVWFSTGWNLELYQQANARLHRQGQTVPVSVHNLVATGTVDERMCDALRGKTENQDSVVRRLAMQIAKDKRR